MRIAVVLLWAVCVTISSGSAVLAQEAVSDTVMTTVYATAPFRAETVSDGDEPMTRLDSIVSFGNQSRASEDKSVAIGIERYIAEYPNSSALKLAIGRAFLYNAILYNPQPHHGTTCEDTVNYDCSDSAFRWISLAFADKTLRDPEFHFPISAWLAQAYTALIVDKIREHDAPTVRRLLINAKLDSVIDPFSLDFAKTLLTAMPKDAIFLNQYDEVASNALLATLYLQVVERERTDVSVIDAKLLLDEAYKDVVGSGLEGVEKPVRLTPHTRLVNQKSDGASDLRTPSLGENEPVVIDTTFIPTEYRKRMAFETGIQQPRFIIDTLWTSHSGYSDEGVLLVSANGWRRPIYRAPFVQTEYLGIEQLHGFVAEILPGNERTRREFQKRDPLASGIAQLFIEKSANEMLSRTSHDHFGELAVSLATTYSELVWPDDSTHMHPVIDALWQMPIATDSSERISVVKLLLRVLDTHPPAGAAEFANGVADQMISLKHLSAKWTYLSTEQKQLYVKIKAALGKCEEVHQLTGRVSMLALLDTVRSDWEGLRSELVDQAQECRCSWAPPKVNLTVYSQHQDPDKSYDASTHPVFSLGDTVALSVGADFADSSIKLMVKWYDAQHSKLLRIDSTNLKRTASIDPPGFHHSFDGSTIFHFVITKDLPKSEYRADVLCNGVYSESKSFNLEGDTDEE